MSNYFNSIGTKSSIRSDKVLDLEDIRTDLLLKVREALDEAPLDPFEIDQLYTDWCDRLFRGCNIAVQGRESKFKLLETFKKRYLDSGRIPDLDDETGARNLDLVIVRLHGFSSLTLQTFQHSVFNYTKNEPFDSAKELNLFVERIRKQRTHYVFLIHSFDLFHTQNPKLSQLIFELYRLEPELVHLLLSADHINAAKILNPLKFQLNLIFYTVPYGSSFFYERISNVDVIDQEAVDANKQLALYHEILDLQSLQDVYQALQQACQVIMVYIFEHHLEQMKHFEQNRRVRGAPSGKRRKPASTRLTRQSKMFHEDEDLQVPGEGEEESLGLEFSKLLKHCESQFIVRRSGTLRNQLGELIDHQLIKMDDSNSRIECLVSKKTCEKFLDYIKSAGDKQ